MKKLLITVIALIVVILGVAAIAPKDFKIEKSITINKPVAEVFAYLKPIKNAENWEPWAKMDPAMTKELKGTDGTVGATSSWSGNSEVGVGEMEIKSIVENEKIDFELRFTKPMQATNQAYFATKAVSATETEVTWGMTGRTPFPYNLICLMMHGKVEKNFEKGLSDLKAILEGGAKVEGAVEAAPADAAEATPATDSNAEGAIKTDAAATSNNAEKK